MNDKFLGWAFGTAAMAACCIGLPFLFAFLTGVGVFAWFADNSLTVLVLVLFVAVMAMYGRDRKKRRHLGTGPAQAIEHPLADEDWPSAPDRREQIPDRRSSRRGNGIGHQPK